MERIRFFDHEGVQILFLDFSSCKADEAIQTIESAKNIIRSQPENSLLVLTDVTDGRFNSEVSDAMKEFAKNNRPFVKASAIVGITGLKKIIFDSVIRFSRRRIHTFADHDSAKEWLLKHS